MKPAQPAASGKTWSRSAAHSFRRDARVIGVVGVAHALSHFFQLVLPPLFPLLRAEFGVSYATLGALMSVFYVASGVCQFGAGFAVDRFGARPVLLGGLGVARRRHAGRGRRPRRLLAVSAGRC